MTSGGSIDFAAMNDTNAPCTGRWISADGRMRVNLNADGTFDEVRTDRARTFHGTYRIDGARIHFRDPATGYEATGELRDDALFADGVEFRRG
jgi:hypothetical protein